MKQASKLMAGLLVSVILLTSCGVRQPKESPEPTEVYIPKGTQFLQTPMRVQTVVTDVSASTLRTVKTNIYIDENSNGEGTLTLGDYEFNLVVSQNIVYIEVGDSFVELVDFDGRMIPNTVEVEGKDDLTVYGFEINADTVMSLSTRKGYLMVDSKYSLSATKFNQTEVLPSQRLELEDAIVYLMDYITELEAKQEPEEVVVDNYIGSRYGVKVNGVTYSVGDICNPDSYFGGARPEGLLESSTYKEDTRVDFLNVSYLTSTGRIVFVLIGNEVQGIRANCDFNFLGIEKGIDEQDLRAKLGYMLSRREMEEFEPIDSKLKVVEYKSNTYYCTAENLNIEFRIQSGVLNEIYVERQLDFKR